MEKLRLKAYVFVERHLSSIDKGIQAAHALVEYHDHAASWLKKGMENMFNQWAHEDKTLILLDGGTAKDLEALAEGLDSNYIWYSKFTEPDLNGCVTAVCVIVDERVFDFEKYPLYDEWLAAWSEPSRMLHLRVNKDDGKIFPTECKYEDWVAMVGGEDNAYLKELIKNKRLAR